MKILNKTQCSRKQGYSSEFSVGYVPFKAGTYIISIDDAIEEVSQFASAIHVMSQATEDDCIQINLQCPGGSMNATGAFIHAMKGCVAPIHIVATGNVSSAATMILLSANSFELSDNFNCCIHNGSSGSVGNLNEYFPKSDFDKKFLYNQYKSLYKDFLTDKEYEDVWEGKNIWMDAEEWVKRIEIRNIIRNAVYEKDTEEAL